MTVLTPTTIRKLERAVLAKRRGTAAEIAARLGVGRDSVTRRARKLGVPFAGKRASEFVLAWVEEDARHGVDRAWTARMLNITKKAVTRLRTRLRKAGRLG